MTVQFTFASGRTAEIKLEKAQDFRSFSNDLNAGGLLIFNDVTINMLQVESFKIIE